MYDKYESVENYLFDNNIFFYKDYTIKWDTYFKSGGKIKFYVLPQNTDEMKYFISFLSASSIDFKIIGLTTNLLFFDEIYYSIVVSTKNLKCISFPDDQHLLVDCGYPLEDLVRIALINNLSGFEGLEGIPGSVGGAIFMNAGAYGFTISDNIVFVECVDEFGEIFSLKKELCCFEYRDSVFKQKKLYILKALFKLQKCENKSISNEIGIYHRARHLYQEYSYPNLGSMISVSGDIYYHIFKHDFFYLCVYFIIKIILKNPLSKFFLRRNPNNLISNKLFKAYLKRQNNENINFNLSNKSINILINNGKSSSADLIKYVYLIYNILHREFKIENEFVLGPYINDEKSISQLIDYLDGKKSYENCSYNNTLCK
ncbi:MAG: UDP-N-acetylmuramate dehydrogenase [Sedimentibacter sp.]